MKSSDPLGKFVQNMIIDFLNTSKRYGEIIIKTKSETIIGEITIKTKRIIENIIVNGIKRIEKNVIKKVNYTYKKIGKDGEFGRKNIIRRPGQRDKKKEER